jgi:hypothetical protein
MLIQMKAKEPMLKIAILCQLRHGARVHHPAIVHDRDRVAERFREQEILLDDKDRGAGGFF